MSNREGNRSQHHFLFSFKVVALFSMSQLIQSKVINTLITYNLPESYTYLVPLCHVISCLINPELKGPYSYNWLRIPGSQALKAATLHFQTLFQNRSCHRKIGVEVMTTKDGICSHAQLSESADMKITELELALPFDRDLQLLPNHRVILLCGPDPPPSLLFPILIEDDKAQLKDIDLEKLWSFGPKILQFRTFLIHDNPLKFTKLQFCLRSVVYNSHSLPRQ